MIRPLDIVAVLQLDFLKLAIYRIAHQTALPDIDTEVRSMPFCRVELIISAEPSRLCRLVIVLAGERKLGTRVERHRHGKLRPDSLLNPVRGFDGFRINLQVAGIIGLRGYLCLVDGGSGEVQNGLCRAGTA